MNSCARLIPAWSRLTRVAVPTRNVFSRRALQPVNLLDRQIADMDRQFARLEREMNSVFRDIAFPFPARTAPRFVDPVVDSNPLFESIQTQVVPSSEAGQPGKYCVRVGLAEGVRPENITVKINDRTLSVHAKMEETSDQGRIYQEVSRSFSLPQNVNPEEVKSQLSSDGVLTIEAPVAELEAPSPKEIPVSIEGKSS